MSFDFPPTSNLLSVDCHARQVPYTDGLVGETGEEGLDEIHYDAVLGAKGRLGVVPLLRLELVEDALAVFKKPYSRNDFASDNLSPIRV